MANPTTNYGFVLPTSSDLVTDLPADFDVALQGVDTRLKALQPGTTLGDLAYSSATANTNTRLGIGSTGNVLTVAGGVPTWAAPAATPTGLTLITAQTVTSSSTVSVNSVFSDTYQNYTVYFRLTGSSGSVQDFRLRVGGADNSDSNSYITQKLDVSNTTVSAVRATTNLFDNAYFTSSVTSANRINFYQPFETVRTYVECHSSINGEEIKLAFGQQTGATSFDGFSLLLDQAVSGTVWVYGWKETV
jgi:hypothetical protein